MSHLASILIRQPILSPLLILYHIRGWISTTHLFAFRPVLIGIAGNFKEAMFVLETRKRYCPLQAVAPYPVNPLLNPYMKRKLLE